MKRWHQEYERFHREWKAHRNSHVQSNLWGWGRRPSDIGADPFRVECVCDEQKGRFRKKDAWDCGNPQCGVCHSDKYPKRELTRGEERNYVSFREQVRELYS